MSLSDRLKHAWNAFMSRDPPGFDPGVGYGYRQDRPRLSRGNERTIVTAVLNRIAVDCASIDVRHVTLDENGRFKEEMDSPLNRCLSLEANIDQSGRALILDAVLSMLDEGEIAIVPVDTIEKPNPDDGFDILSMRVGRIVEWHPQYVKVSVYNERVGHKEEIFVSKKTTTIVENPFFSIMNEPNSIMQRLIRKLALLDAIDEQSGSGKLDLLIQLPYAIRTDLQKERAEIRRKSLEDQLSGSKFGIGYIDSTEHVTQLNRSVENNLMKQIEYLAETLYSQLGITTEIMNGTADDKTMTNYYNRIIEPIMTAIAEGMHRAFLSEDARSEHQAIRYFRDPFKLVPVSQVPEFADKLTRNEVMTSNEIRQIIGLMPSDDPSADELRNKNLNQSNKEFDENHGNVEERSGQIQNE